MDLPVEDDAAGLSEYADVVVEAIDDRRISLWWPSRSVATSPQSCERVAARLLVLVAGMVPSPGESAEEMFADTGYKQEEQDDPGDRAVFYHDVPPRLAAEAIARGAISQAPRAKSPGR